jgi:hypothetical protein
VIALGVPAIVAVPLLLGVKFTLPGSDVVHPLKPASLSVGVG